MGRVGVILIDLPSCALLFLAVVILLIHPAALALVQTEEVPAL